MTLYNNVPFTDGTEFTPDLAYQSFYSPVFDGQTQYLGHRNKIQDSELDDAGTSLKGRLALVTDGFLVTVSSGLNLQYNAGIVRMTNGLVQSIAGGLIAVPDNSTNLIWIDNTGTVSVGTIAPSIRTLLAQVTTVGGSVSLLKDLRQAHVKAVSPVASAIRVFGGTSSTDHTCTNGETFSAGIYYYRNFTVPSGVSITVTKGMFLYCSGNFQCDGVINVTTSSAGATGFATVATTASQGGLSGGGIGGGSGSLSTSVTSYPYKLQPTGSGGGLGYGSGTVGSGFQFANGGAGGGTLWVEAYGTIIINGNILAKGAAGAQSTVLGGTVYVSGSGGGSGGLIYLASLQSILVNASAVLDVSAGRGGDGLSNMAAGQGSGNGGSGGGGGYIVLQSPSNNTTTATINLAGGAFGTPAGSGVSLGGGGGGGFGGNGGSQSAGSSGQLLSLTYLPLG